MLQPMYMVPNQQAWMTNPVTISNIVSIQTNEDQRASFVESSNGQKSTC
jgi:hypothetical protein